MPPYPPRVGVNCDKCHFMRSEPSVVVRDLFYKYETYVRGRRPEVLPKTEVLISFFAELILFKLCLITLECEIASSPCEPKCSPSEICVSGECICPVGWKACYGECIHPLKICSIDIATSPPTTAIPTSPADGISTWPPTVEGRVVVGGGGWPPITQSTWPPTILSTLPPITATTDAPTVTHGACHCSSCCVKEDCNNMASCFPYCVNLYDEYECTGGDFCDDMNPCSGLCTPTCASMGGCCVDQDCEILNSENPWDTNEYTCIGGELCDRQHPCSGTCVPAVCPNTSCCTNEDCIEFSAPPYLIYECDVEGVICDDRNPCAGFCELIVK